MKRIIAINTSNSGGGAENVAYTLCREMHQRGFDSRLMAGRIDYAADPLAQQLVVGVPGPKILYSAGNVLDEIFTTQYLWYLPSYLIPRAPVVADADVVHLHNLHGNYFNPRILPTLFRRKPVVWTLHDMWAFTGKCVSAFACTRYQDACGNCPYLQAYPAMKLDRSAYHLRLKRKFVDGATAVVVTPSEWMRKHVATSILKDLPTMTIPSPVETTVFYPEPKEDARNRLGIPMEKQVVLFIASVVDGSEAKGATVLRGMLSALKAKFPELFLVVIGEVKGAPLLSPGIEGRQTGWISDRTILRGYYAAADILVAPTLAENSPCTIVESMACGTPAVAYGVGGIPEQITDRRNGFLVPAGDTRGLLNGVIALLDEPERAMAMGKDAAATVYDRFSLTQCADLYIKAYEVAIRLKGGPAGGTA